jgi:hypothetical protein
MPLDKDIQDRYSSETGAYEARKSSGSGYYEKDLRRSKYEINIQQYPSDLGSEDLLHYIEFGINVRGKSELDKSKRLYEIKRNPDSANMSEDELSTVTTAGAFFGAGAVTAGLTKTILSKIPATGALRNATTALGSQKAADTVISVGAGVVAGGIAATAVNVNKLLKPDTTYRISDVIALYVDGPPVVRYSMNYANKDLGTLAGIIKGGVVDTLKAFSPFTEQGAAALATFAKLPGAFGLPDLKTALSASSKTALNPFKETIFESVDFRTFAFKYKFLPKSKQESEAVRNIVKLFKYHMHPDISKNKLFFIYPSEFQITYYFQSTENNYFHKFAPCALASMEVSYGGEQFSSFDDGNPTEVNMTLTFQETEILTKSLVDQGY